MLRKMTKDVGRLKKDSEHDYPRDVWNTIAAQSKQDLDSISVAIESNKVLQSSLKGRPQIHKRLGASQ